MYRIDYKDKKSAIHKLYQFMTNPTLTKPECALWRENMLPVPIVNDDGKFMSFEEFRQKLSLSNLLAAVCTASTDVADTNRVVLTYAPEIEYMVLNFPTSTEKINSVQRKIYLELSNG